ncbi:MAG: hemolysin family protein [Candidatus Cloacimonetes bacterium]|nr:hemolysin family protein [Candidatus Cloacimonadota bacterium]
MEIIALFFIILFFILSMFFSGMETGLISIDRLKLEQDAKEDKLKKKLLSFIEEPNRYLGVTLIGNNISVVVVSTIFTVYFAQLLPLDKSISILLLAAFMLIFAEIVPKSISRENSNIYVTRLFPILFFFYLILRPFISIINLFYAFLTKYFGLERDNRYSFLTREDLAIILSESNLGDSIEQPQRDMLEEVLDFNELIAKNVMTPRTDIMAISNDKSVQEIIELAKQEGYTRYPVYEQDIDNIIGILIIYDLLKKNSSNNLRATDFAREALFVPETIDLNALLKEMQQKRKSMAVVVDNFGGTAGLVTIEDILEELVGEIEDEYDFEEVEDKDIQKINDNEYVVKGFVEIDHLNDEFDAELPEGDYETLAGLIISNLMRIPSKGTKINVGKWRLEVLQASSSKVIKVIMKKNN